MRGVEPSALVARQLVKIVVGGVALEIEGDPAFDAPVEDWFPAPSADAGTGEAAIRVRLAHGEPTWPPAEPAHDLVHYEQWVADGGVEVSDRRHFAARLDADTIDLVARDDEFSRWAALHYGARHLLNLALGRRGRHPVHASAVAVEGRAVAFVGPSGAGKSTAAALLARRLGAPLLGDDQLLVLPEPLRVGGFGDRPRVLGASPAHAAGGRTLPSGKRALDPPAVTRDLLAPGLLVYFGDHDADVVAVDPAESMGELVRAGFFGIDPWGDDEGRLRALAALAESVPAVRVPRHRTLEPDVLLSWQDRQP